ncbi:MAG: hypothetical protein ACLQQ4_15905 [Bacteroidia bacterium]
MPESLSFPFYSEDFLMGTLSLPMEDRGKYITLLCYMHRYGRMTGEMAKQLVGDVSKPLRAKFRVDENGCWYNIRLEKEIKAREKFIKSRRSNGNKGGRPRAGAIHESPLQPSHEQVKACFMSKGLPEPESEYESVKFMAYYSARGWKTSSGVAIVNWKAAVTNWILHRNQFMKNKQQKTLTEQWLE